MNVELPQLPPFRQFLWQFFMQPVTLHYCLKACGIENPNATFQALWFDRDANRSVKRQYVKYLLGLLFVVMPVVTVIAASFVLDIYIYILPEYVINFEECALGMALGIAFGVGISITNSVEGSPTRGLAQGVKLGMGFSIAFGMTLCVSVGVAVDVVGVAWGLTLGVARGLGLTTKSLARELAGQAVFSIGLGVVGGVAVGLAFFLCFSVFLFRLPLYPLEAIGQILFYSKQKAFGQITLHRIPVLHHELSYLPHPWLTNHIFLNAEHNPQLVKQVIAACRIAPGQRRAGEFALAQLQAQELVQQVQQHRFNQIVELQGKWLPGVEGATAPLLVIRELARYLRAAQTTHLPYHSLQHLQRAQQQYQALENQLLTDHSPLADALRATLPTWNQLIKKMVESAW